MDQRRIYNAKTVTGLRAGSGSQNQQFTDLVPGFTNTYNIGSNSLVWKNLYVQDASIQNNLTVAGSTQMQNIFTFGNVELRQGAPGLGNLTVTGNVNVNGTSVLVGNTNIKGNLTIDGTLSFGGINYADIVGNTAVIGNPADNSIENSGGPANLSTSTIITPRLAAVGAVTTPFLNVMGYAIADQLRCTRITDTTSRTDANAGLILDGGLAVAKTVWANDIKSDGTLTANTLNTATLSAITSTTTGDSTVQGTLVLAKTASANTNEYLLRMQRNNTTAGRYLTIGFGGDASTYSKGSIAYQRTGSFDRGEISIYTNNNADNSDVMASEGRRVRIGADGNIILSNSTVQTGTTNTRPLQIYASWASTENVLNWNTSSTGYAGIEHRNDISTTRFYMGVGGSAVGGTLQNAPYLSTTSASGVVPIVVNAGLNIIGGELALTRPLTTNTFEYVAKFARSNLTNGRFSVIGLGTEGSGGYYKAGLAYQRTDTFDRGEVTIFNQNLATISNATDSYATGTSDYRRMRLDASGNVLFNNDITYSPATLPAAFTIASNTPSIENCMVINKSPTGSSGINFINDTLTSSGYVGLGGTNHGSVSNCVFIGNAGASQKTLVFGDTVEVRKADTTTVVGTFNSTGLNVNGNITATTLTSTSGTTFPALTVSNTGTADLMTLQNTNATGAATVVLKNNDTTSTGIIGIGGTSKPTLANYVYFGNIGAFQSTAILGDRVDFRKSNGTTIQGKFESGIFYLYSFLNSNEQGFFQGNLGTAGDLNLTGDGKCTYYQRVVGGVEKKYGIGVNPNTGNMGVLNISPGVAPSWRDI